MTLKCNQLWLIGYSCQHNFLKHLNDMVTLLLLFSPLQGPSAGDKDTGRAHVSADSCCDNASACGLAVCVRFNENPSGSPQAADRQERTAHSSHGEWRISPQMLWYFVCSDTPFREANQLKGAY